MFSADIIVVADAGNWKLDEPTLTTTLRGFVVLDVTVSTLKQRVRSGMYGGVAPDAFVALIRMLASLHDERGNVAVKDLKSDLYTGKPDERQGEEKRYRTEASVLDGVGFIGDGGIRERLCVKPSISVTGSNGVPKINEAANVLLPTATAWISVRLVPSQDPKDALESLQVHLQTFRPWNVHLEMKEIARGRGFTAGPAGPEGGYYPTAKQALGEAFTKNQVVSIGQGGSISLVSVLQQVNPNATILLLGCEEPQARIHGSDESVDLGELTRMILTETYLLSYLREAEPPARVEQDYQNYEPSQHMADSCFL
jgi:cysteinylglycine-S-conjugate dipeptidase